MAQKLRAPPIAAPAATSAATFSLGAHSQKISSNNAASVISVLGVPG